MPFLRMDPEMYDEFASELGDDVPEGFGERPSGDFEYDAATAKFKPAELGAVAKVIYDALVAAGAKSFRVKYDGGFDEGFSHPDSLRFASGDKPVDAVARELTAPALLEAVRSLAGNDSKWGNSSEMYRKTADDKVVIQALDELAYELASKLLGDGFGTGEYELYGALTADLATGEIVDHADAPKPHNVK